MYDATYNAMQSAMYNSGLNALSCHVWGLKFAESPVGVLTCTLCSALIAMAAVLANAK